ncbi:hypothetical protein LMG31884_03210 [Xanthomonas hydrangeae]|nr:hypothetical protein LMG31884_03210 [Xanthomonas hydrangeae]CAD7712878.1 hypothetical protein LMG31884_03210 [Xanthomonas hydrangeae]CAD7718325.1 hypothetical protein LMG31887_03200 [Xanthomonas hydrangeae]CAD7718327.1 hypothetical protein LMG31887_03200 [Xanthomonas hydrangeae]
MRVGRAWRLRRDTGRTSRDARHTPRCSQQLGQQPSWPRARCPHRLRDTPQVRPCRLGGGIHAATRSRNRRGHRTRQLVGARSKSCLHCGVHQTLSRRFMVEQGASSTALPCKPTNSTGPCPPTVAGPYAAWMPRKSLHGRIHGVSCDGGRARALQPSRSVEGAVPSPLAGHAVNPSLGTVWRHPCRHTVPQLVRTPHQKVSRLLY